MTTSQRLHEVAAKLQRVRAHLETRGLQGALFATPGNFAWITGGGRNHVSVGGDLGVGAVLVTSDAAYLLANNIELDRLLEEELPGLGFEGRSFPWWSSDLTDEVARILPLSQILSDVPGIGEHQHAAEGMALRNPLLPEERERYRRLGEDVGVVLTHAAFHCRPALSERQLAGMIARTCADLGMEPLVTLVAVDERIAMRRHPLPTDRRLERCALLVLTARRQGLHVSASRMVHFGPIPEDLQRRHHACVQVDATLLATTRPGARLRDVFHAAAAAYEKGGFPGEWQYHHQGGPTGYAPRDLKVTPETAERVLEGQAFAWNPTVAGTKCEDTVLVLSAGTEVVSLTPDLPALSVEMAGHVWERPAILER